MLSLSIFLFPSISFIEGVEAADDGLPNTQPEVNNTLWQANGKGRFIINLKKKHPSNTLSGVQSVNDGNTSGASAQMVKKFISDFDRKWNQNSESISGSSQRVGDRSEDDGKDKDYAPKVGIEWFYAVMNQMCEFYVSSDEGHLYKLGVDGEMIFVDDICEKQQSSCEKISASSIENMTWDDSGQLYISLDNGDVFVYSLHTQVLEKVVTLSDEQRKTISEGSLNQLKLINPDSLQETTIPYNNVGSHVENIVWIPKHCLK